MSRVSRKTNKGPQDTVNVPTESVAVAAVVSEPVVASERVDVDVGNDSAPVVTEKKFADQIREMVTMADQMKSHVNNSQKNARNEQFCLLADQFMADMRQKIEVSKKRLRSKNNHSLNCVIYPPKMFGKIPSHVFIYGGSPFKKGSEEKRDFQSRDKNFFRKKGYKISLIEELQLETFDRDGLFLLNVSDPSKGYQTRFIISADTNPEEMMETLWHNQNKIPDLKKLRFVENNRPQFLNLGSSSSNPTDVVESTDTNEQKVENDAEEVVEEEEN
jgi:hypothetical protein